MKKVRYVIAAISLFISLILAFFVAPRMQKFSYSKVFVVRARKEIQINQTITAEDVEYVEVVDHNLPSNIIKDINAVVGKVSPVSISAKQWLGKGDFQGVPKLGKQISERLKEGEQLMSIGIKERSHALNFQIFPGDIVAVYSEVMEADKAGDLQDIEVFSVHHQDQKLVLTVIVKPDQARILAHLEAKNRLHLALRQRHQITETSSVRGKDV